MAEYYRNLKYHRELVDGYNKDWSESNQLQLKATSLIPPESTLIEVGCGAGDAMPELVRRIPGVRYFGLDLNWKLWPHHKNFVAGSATTLPFPDRCTDYVISMYAIEHICYPREFLDEAWRIARTAVIIIAPDFTMKPMASETIGLSYGSGREKLKRGRWIDASLTGIGNLLVLFWRKRRLQKLLYGTVDFPVLLNPCCLRRNGFSPDCDAVYPVSPLEIKNHYSAKPEFKGERMFYNDRSSFGSIYSKNEC